MKSHYLQAIIAVVLLFSLFNLLSKSPVGRFFLWTILCVGVVFVVVLWMLKNRRETLSRCYSNPAARYVIDLVCKVSNEQPPVDSSEQNQEAEQELLLQTPADFAAMTQHIKTCVRGFEPVIDRISNHLNRAIAIRRRASATEQFAPLGSFLVAGPSGIGKSYLCEHFGACLYASGKTFHFNLRDVSTQAFLGSTGEDGSLLKAAVEAPRATFILENPAAADPRILEFLQHSIFTRGAVEDSAKGKTIGFRESLFFLVQEVDQADVVTTSFLTEKGGGSVDSHLSAANASKLPPGLLQTMDQIHIHPLPDHEVVAEVLLILMQQQCDKYRIELTHVDPALVAEGVATFRESGFAAAPSWVHRKLHKPLHRAAEMNATELRLFREDLAQQEEL